MVFKSKGRQMIGYSDTLWYGSDHCSLCYHLEDARRDPLSSRSQ
jgi:hypothetical protein